MTDDKKNTDPITPPMKMNPGLKEYRCPHCGKFLFKGNVKRLNMVCHHCQRMIDADDTEFFKSDMGQD